VVEMLGAVERRLGAVEAKVGEGNRETQLLRQEVGRDDKIKKAS